MIRKIKSEERPTIDARAAGAKCDECPLKKCNPVPPEVRNSKLVILGEAPGANEDAVGKPFIGASGYRLNKALRELGVKRNEIHTTNTLLCYAGKKLTTAEWKTAIACCEPRLSRELGRERVVLATGAKALEVTTGKAKITPWMGAPLKSRIGIVIGSIHPAFALRKPAYLPVFKTFLARAVRLANGSLKPWQWPEMVADASNIAALEPALQRLLALAQQNIPVAIDIENNPITEHIRCIGVGTAEFAVSVPVELKLSDKTHQLLRQIIATNTPKVLQNAQFDVVELRQAGYELNGEIRDTLLMHAVVAPQLPHDLSFMCAVEFHAERWKTEFHIEGDDKGAGKKLKRFAAAPLSELLPYNAKDVLATAILEKQLWARIGQTHRGAELNAKIHKLDAVAMKMRDWGFAVETKNLEHHKESLNEELWRQCFTFRQLVPDMSIQLGKSGIHVSLNSYFFDYLKLTPVSTNQDTGAPSLDSKALQAYVAMYAETKPPVSELARCIYRYRKYAKLLGSYIENLPMGTNSRVHPWWRVFGSRTGRWSATDPAIQTIPKPNKQAGTPGMRDLFCASASMFLVEADYSQLELRIVALLSGDELLLQWYAEGRDVHTMNAMAIFNTKEPLKQQRELAKRVVYGLNYGGSADTVWRSLITDFPGLKLSAVEHVVDQWFKTHPKIVNWQNTLKEQAQKQGYVEEVLSGRRQYYHDGRIVPTEVLNYPVQGAAGELANRAILSISKELNWSNEAILAQVHDSILTEGVNQGRLIEVVRSAMEQEVELNGATIKFPVDVSVGTNWAYLEKVL